MYLVRLIYASRAHEGFSTSDIESILQRARIHNKRHAITGLLCFNNEYFLQCLEGSRLRVNALFRQILADPRHHEVLLLDYREIDRRDFGTWSMAYAGIGPSQSHILLDHSTTAQFDPFALNNRSAHSLLHSLAATLDSARADVPRGLAVVS